MQRLAQLLAAAREKAASKKWWITAVVGLVCVLVEDRFAGKINEALDKWVIPVLPGVLGAISRYVVSPYTFIAGFLVLLSVNAWLESRKPPPSVTMTRDGISVDPGVVVHAEVTPAPVAASGGVPIPRVTSHPSTGIGSIDSLADEVYAFYRKRYISRPARSRWDEISEGLDPTAAPPQRITAYDNETRILFDEQLREGVRAVIAQLENDGIEVPRAIRYRPQSIRDLEQMVDALREISRGIGDGSIR